MVVEGWDGGEGVVVNRVGCGLVLRTGLGGVLCVGV